MHPVSIETGAGVAGINAEPPALGHQRNAGRNRRKKVDGIDYGMQLGDQDG